MVVVLVVVVVVVIIIVLVVVVVDVVVDIVVVVVVDVVMVVVVVVIMVVIGVSKLEDFLILLDNKEEHYSYIVIDPVLLQAYSPYFYNICKHNSNRL
jgi:hypothetical protein